MDLKEQQEVPAAACLCDRRKRDSPHRRASGISFLLSVLSPSRWQPPAYQSVGDMSASDPRKTKLEPSSQTLCRTGPPDFSSPTGICLCQSVIVSNSLLGHVIQKQGSHFSGTWRRLQSTGTLALTWPRLWRASLPEIAWMSLVSILILSLICGLKAGLDPWEPPTGSFSLLWGLLVKDC